MMNAFKIAAEYRQKFKKDVVVDLIGYRKFGHNELDQPMFTQPLMYSVIKKMEPVRDVYRNQLISEGIKEEELVAIEKANLADLEDSYKKSKTVTFESEDWNSEQWEEIKDPALYGKHKDTGVPIDILTEMGKKITVLPEESSFHSQIKKIYAARHKSILEGKGIDWGTAEALAFASLINEGHHVRLSGQDVERGTFSHRHAHVHY